MSAKADTQSTEPLDEQAVREFLSQRPDFLAGEPELLASLEVPDDTAATSLLEYQVSVLRDKNQELNRRLRDYHEVAESNAELLEKIHGLYELMIGAESEQALVESLCRRLKADFRCDVAVVALYAENAGPACVSLHGDVVDAEFSSLRARPEPACGRLRQRKRELLFGVQADSVESVVIAPLSAERDQGLLALGSHDEDRFHPGMGTLFISLLARMLGETLNQLDPGEPPKPA